MADQLTEENRLYFLTLTESQLRLLWLGTEVLREANMDDADAIALDQKVTDLIKRIEGRPE